MYTLALLVNVAGLLWACGIAMRFRTIQAGPIMQMPVFLILFFAPVYVPLALLTGWIETVATLNPLTYVLEAARSMLAGRRDPRHLGLRDRARPRLGVHGLVAARPAQGRGCGLGSPPGRVPSRRMRVWPGKPFPLGPTWDGEGTNFSLFSEHAERGRALPLRRRRTARRASS